MLEGKNALITGGSRGIGKAISLEFAKNGANVAILYSGNVQAAEETAEEIREAGVKAWCVKCDVSDFTACKSEVTKLIKEMGGVDILVNNAGVTRDGLIFSMKEEDYDRVLDTNLKGAFNMIKCCYANFLKRRKGRIINISSIVGITGNAGQANYAASKAGLIGLTKSVAKELAPRGICCNAIAPGFVETEMTKNLAAAESYMSAIPLGRAAKPEDIAKCALFLASDDASYITGEVIRVDGGLAI